MIRYVIGDATRPLKTPGYNNSILHVCNDIGKWGKGFVVALSNRWPEPKQAFLSAYNENMADLGTVQPVFVEETDGIRTNVMNMIAQHGIVGPNNPHPIRYDSLFLCLQTIAKWHENTNSTIHMPRIGCGLAGGDWNVVESLIANTLCKANLLTTVYDL